MQLSRDDLLAAYRTMRTIREFESRVHAEAQAGRVPGSTHLYAGQEAVATGVCMALREGDTIASTHRGHGHCIAMGLDVGPMMAEILGKATGTCKGKGGSMHIADLEKGMLGANGIVGGGPPLVCGAALAAKTLGTGAVSVCFSGDGAVNQGTTAESLNLSMVWTLPVIFVVEDNGWGEATSAEFAVAGDIVERARGYGMPAVRVDGLSLTEVHEAAREAVGRAREGGGPSLLHVKTERFFGHFNGDVDTYRSEAWKAEQRANRDCILRFRAMATEAGLVAAEDLDSIDREVAALLDEAVRAARAAPEPDPARVLTTDVYVSYEGRL
ncbi:thiamine pyrophosphate-dependent dehydrogenase E1 component subunit alpha [Rubellimicrobium sp. CFH 75288]|uniref:thiamine pyrophosphate-dependent dehydrogenase E1 component subunit alpha n=1 Tax=Rubellimicrobium sp. CFH 75288 TaxID=2697034 RepID=UPI001412AB16|nr:thiamine pyrophosphate-dependent dehydrogenase E1 component subunit alpha [Rubellimicrobium sp. CFH 75288]NAZ35306.1 ABC transporter substrate-binding protein [Rubellimicrobium sp. CFH 75288]